ncbi:MAG: hypothetical protein ACRC0L_04885 [Angustibacter sp.]
MDALSADIPKGKFSAWVYEAMREKRERDNLRFLVEEFEARNGPAAEAEVEQATLLLQ